MWIPHWLVVLCRVPRPLLTIVCRVLCRAGLVVGLLVTGHRGATTPALLSLATCVISPEHWQTLTPTTHLDPYPIVRYITQHQPVQCDMGTGTLVHTTTTLRAGWCQPSVSPTGIRQLQLPSVVCDQSCSFNKSHVGRSDAVVPEPSGVSDCRGTGGYGTILFCAKIISVVCYSVWLMLGQLTRKGWEYL